MTESAEPREINAPQSQGLKVTSQIGGTTPTQNLNLTVDLGEKAGKAMSTLVILSICSGFSVAFSILTFLYLHDQQLSTQRSAEQMRIQLASQNAILEREGFVRPGDEWMGPEGNLHFNPELLHRRK